MGARPPRYNDAKDSVMPDETLSDALVRVAAAFRRQLRVPIDAVIFVYGPNQLGPFPVPTDSDAAYGEIRKLTDYVEDEIVRGGVGASK